MAEEAGDSKRVETFGPLLHHAAGLLAALVKFSKAANLEVGLFTLVLGSGFRRFDLGSRYFGGGLVALGVALLASWVGRRLDRIVAKPRASHRPHDRPHPRTSSDAGQGSR